jgi:3',5'-cyclic-AMP phosphodiesterase
MQKPLQVVQFTDTHIFASQDGRLLGVDTFATFTQVRDLAAQQHAHPDFYLLTGDLSQDETPGSYARFAGAIAGLPAPAYFVPGNHDVDGPMQSVFCAQGNPLSLETEFGRGSWQFILLNSHEDGRVGGVLADVEVDRLDQFLSRHSQSHVLIVLHHHPIPIGSAWIDTIGLENHEAFHQVLHKHDNVRAVLFGHIHQAFDKEVENVRYLGTPSTCVQFKPRTEKFGVDAVPPGYRWLELHEDGSLQTGVNRVVSVASGLDVASAGY